MPRPNNLIFPWTWLCYQRCIMSNKISEKKF